MISITSSPQSSNVGANRAPIRRVPIDLEVMERSILDQFQTQVSCRGHHPAIIFQERLMTYDELNRWSNRIAREILTRRGVGAEPIALLLDTGPAMIAGMLGVLKAGKFYVPLDVTWPVLRLQTILEDSQVELIVCHGQDSSGDNVESGIELESVLGDRATLWLNELNSELSDQNLNLEVQADDLAYVLYTSGSSGRPKGVMQNHRYVLNLYRNYTNSGGITENDRLSLLYSAAFGGAVRDIYCALLNGATLLPLDVKQIGLHQLGSWLQDYGITVTFMVATLFRHFVATLEAPESFPVLRLLQVGSETVYRRDGELFQQYFPQHCTLMVNLGGTEISPIRQFPIHKHTVLTGQTIPAGYEVEGTEIVLWDEAGQTVAPGEVGEIVVASHQVALGYWQQPERTEAVFVSRGDRRYFKTGDLGQFLPDGCLLHLGRKDFQVKIRGYRVETSEVEGVLVGLESVREAVVVARADISGIIGDRLLLAYLTAVDFENKPTAKALKEAMAAWLPDYAIPAHFVWLESFPLTATGKIDRRSLPDPQILSISDLDIIPARNATETRLVQIWSEVLNLQTVGVDNNFFDLGGNSLHASQVAARIAETFKSELSLKTIFAAPTIAQLAQYLESAKAKASLPTVGQTATLREPKNPLSFAQQRLWFLNQLEPNTSIYNLFRGFRLQGTLDVGCLEKAIEALIERHEILRTSFEVVDGDPVQSIAPSLPFALEISDLKDLPAREQTTKVGEITKELQGWIFDLAQPPLLKIRLIRLSDREHNLLLTMHHIISDDWSIQVFLKEVSAIYRALHENHAYPLSPLSIQYTDYTHWQHQYLAGEVVEAQLDYWRSQLADAPPLLELPTDFPRSKNTSSGFESGIVSVQIDGDTTEKLNALSRRSQTTLFVTLLTAWSVLLSRYSNQDDIVVGTASANRNPAITEQLIGFFVSTLALRIKLADHPTFLNLLDRVQQTALDAHAHADIPFDRLLEKLQIQRGPNDNPVFQVMFILQNVAQETLAFPDLETARLDFAKPTAGATFDLTLSLQENNEGEKNGGLVGTLEYNTHLFAAATIERMADHFLRLVGAIANSPEMAIADYPLLSTQERQQLLIEWNQTTTDYPRHACVHHLFESQAEKTPDAIALVFGEQTLTYAELNQQANRVARYLQAMGVGVECLVGVCLERSPKLIVALLAILKAGAAYLPLDPTYPGERLALMVEDAQLETLLTENDKGRWFTGVASCIDLDAVEEKIANYSTENAIAPTTTTALAYAMYTSGSTGQPKGVCVTHRNIVRLVKNSNYASFKPNDVFLQLASVSFDAATLEIWGSLLNGARLVLCPEQQPSLTALGKILRQHQVTILWLTAGLFHVMVDEGLEDLQSLRFLMAGGDVLSVTHVKKCCQTLPNCRLINGYGPTENTMFTCCYSIDASIFESGTMAQSIPIGRPIANTQAYILDSQKQPVPIGVAGELYAGGDGVARGYLNRPELNAERFIPNPFVEGDRLYKTGDMARYLPDGNIEFLRRCDRQAKIRGFRIEPGEIEAVISQHPAVNQALVIVHEKSLGDKSLVVYVTGTVNGESEQLNQFLEQKLPDYLRPNTIVWLAEFPLTANGKVDRRALPLPDWEGERETELVAPRTPTETVIAEMIADVLVRERVGIHENLDSCTLTREK